MVCIEVDIVTGKSFISKLKSKHKGNAELFPYDEQSMRLSLDAPSALENRSPDSGAERTGTLWV